METNKETGITAITKVELRADYFIFWFILLVIFQILFLVIGLSTDEFWNRISERNTILF